jgi:YhcH/YjgK/YiaL family protein
MIVDKISNRHLYFKNEVFEVLFEQLKGYTLETPDGIYKNHPNFYFKVMSYNTKLVGDITESHRKEVDVQILLAGKEGIKVFDSQDVVITQIYEASTDCQFYMTKKSPISEVNLVPGYMAVLFPEDIHNPQYAVNGKIEKLKKIVIKIDAKLFT